VEDGVLARLTDVFKMLADKSRLQILLTLARDGQRHVSALCTVVRQSQPMVSHHLTLMRMAGLVDCNRVGQHHFYRLASGNVRSLLEQFFNQVGEDGQQLRFSDFALTFAPN
jgi:ArsR family transcriptional regulator